MGKCRNFNGSNSYIKFMTPLFDNSVTEFSYACWFYPTTAHTGCLFSNRTSTAKTGILLCYNSNTIVFDTYNRWNFTPSTAIIVGAWNHLTFTYKKGEKKCFYLNGVLIDSTTASSEAPTTANATYSFIGGS